MNEVSNRFLKHKEIPKIFSYKLNNEIPFQSPEPTFADKYCNLHFWLQAVCISFASFESGKKNKKN